MIEAGKVGIFGDLAMLSTLLLKYRALQRLVEQRDSFVSRGILSLEGAERETRRLAQQRIARQFPGALAELERLDPDAVSALILNLRSYLCGEMLAPREALDVLHAVSDYHFALSWILRADGRQHPYLPSTVSDTGHGGGASSRVGAWVREKYGLVDRCQVWKLDIRWIRGS